MPYVLTRFDDLLLPAWNRKLPLDNGAAADGLVALADGQVFDSWGDARAPAQWPAAEELVCTLFEISGATALDVALDALKAKSRRRGKLYRTKGGDASAQWAWARMLPVDGLREEAIHDLHQPLTLRWQRFSAWYGVPHGAPWYFDDGHYFDDGMYFDTNYTYTLSSSPYSAISLPNAGSADVTDCIIEVTAGGADITALTIANTTTGATLTFAGVIAAGTTLTIDCGAYSVLNDGVDAYNSLTVTATTYTVDWFRLPAQTTCSVTVTLTGGGTDSTATFTYHESSE